MSELREAIVALRDDWANDGGIVSPDSRFTRDAMVLELDAVLSQHVEDDITRHVREALNAAAEAVGEGVLPSHPNQGYRDGFARAAQIVRNLRDAP